MSTLSSRTSALLVVFASLGFASAQTFRRLGTCPTLGCVFPPDQTDFLAGQLFDIRLEVHAPVNGSEASNNGVPDEKFKFCIQSDKGSCTDVAKFFSVQDPVLEKWSFSFVFSSVMTIPWTSIRNLVTSRTCLRKMREHQISSTLLLRPIAVLVPAIGQFICFR